MNLYPDNPIPRDQVIIVRIYMLETTTAEREAARLAGKTGLDAAARKVEEILRKDGFDLSSIDEWIKQHRPNMLPPPPPPPPEVDWKAVNETEHWLQEEREAGRIGFRPFHSFPDPETGEWKTEYNPVGHIDGVLWSGCAGYAVKEPRAPEVLAAIAADEPTEREWYALESYLIEAGTDKIIDACLAGELDLTKMMHKVEDLIQKRGYAPQSTMRWISK